MLKTFSSKLINLSYYISWIYSTVGLFCTRLTTLVPYFVIHLNCIFVACFDALLGFISDQEFWYKKYKIYEFSHNFSQNIIEEWFIWQTDLSVRSKRNRRTNHQPKLPRAIIEKAIKSFVGPHTLENSLKLALYGPILIINFYSQVNISHCLHSTLLYNLKILTRKTDQLINKK